jgi:hypothetical protein
MSLTCRKHCRKIGAGLKASRTFMAVVRVGPSSLHRPDCCPTVAPQSSENQAVTTPGDLATRRDWPLSLRLQNHGSTTLINACPRLHLHPCGQAFVSLTLRRPACLQPVADHRHLPSVDLRSGCADVPGPHPPQCRDLHPTLH